MMMNLAPNQLHQNPFSRPKASLCHLGNIRKATVSGFSSWTSQGPFVACSARKSSKSSRHTSNKNKANEISNVDVIDDAMAASPQNSLPVVDSPLAQDILDAVAPADVPTAAGLEDGQAAALHKPAVVTPAAVEATENGTGEGVTGTGKAEALSSLSIFSAQPEVSSSDNAAGEGVPRDQPNNSIVPAEEGEISDPGIGTSESIQHGQLSSSTVQSAEVTTKDDTPTSTMREQQSSSILEQDVNNTSITDTDARLAENSAMFEHTNGSSAQQGPSVGGGERVKAPKSPYLGSAEKDQRPFLPLVNLQALLETLTGEPTAPPELAELLQLNLQGTTPFIFTPPIERAPGSPNPSTLPIVIYLPGIDGSGLAAYRQFKQLASSFDLRALNMPPGDRLPFADLVSHVESLIRAELVKVAPSRPVYLLGESFGAIMALALGERCRDIVDRLVLVNPATSFPSTPWASGGQALTQLPDQIYRLLPVALSPILTNPLSLASHAVDPSDPLPKQLSDLLYGLVDLLPMLPSLRLVLPPDTLAWRLRLLNDGATAVEPMLASVPQRTLIVAGQVDQLIPSAKESERLEKAMPRARAIKMEGHGHALLQEGGVDLAEMMKDLGFYISERRLSTTPKPKARVSKRGAVSGAAFGTPAPLELPTPREILHALERDGLANLKRLVSPVYYSTYGDGRVVQGLGAIPNARPLLFVGNHQLFALDMPLMIANFLSERGMLLRGLATPTVMDKSDPAGIQALLATYGAVSNGAFNMHALLEAGEAVLLYPGGVREAIKQKGEEYKLLWPIRSEFVRMAARFGATVIPFGAVGLDDSVTQVLDSKELDAMPIVGDWLRSRGSASRQSRRGTAAGEGLTDSFIFPVVAPRVPKRYYFHFQPPIALTPEMAADRELCTSLYSHIRGEVESAIQLLLDRRRYDPYAQLLPRLVYEAIRGGKVAAPSFDPKPLKLAPLPSMAMNK